MPARRCRKDLKITPLFDQSVFVKAAVQGVVREALIAAALTAAMILLFLGNWRSTCIIAVSDSAVDPLVDARAACAGRDHQHHDAGRPRARGGYPGRRCNVTIENIERHLHMGTDLHEAILEGRRRNRVPAFVSTLCICIVFVPMFFLTGVARFLFVPLAEAVVFAMLASYILSRTLVPTLVMLLMGHAHKPKNGSKPNLFMRLYHRFDAGFERMRATYIVILSTLLVRRRVFAVSFLGFCVLSVGLVFALGRRLLPDGRFRRHPLAHACADRHADRRNRAARGRSGESGAGGRAGRSTHHAPRQPRLAV
jgi:multidrug efflux pump subunit AcrB